ncbi:hypothetical protein [Streptomyces silvensis]|uniref:Uncharacterized protein n=1 Tax=Streptomyces silvensis TaxID=1765722 RepID=A0A0W7WY87_9ACTN|nr:hypothetical protein [Streptomyces silvensis]KUF15447.1 hypothetical protein AT728_25590 [Streptomyces silvensis]
MAQTEIRPRVVILLADVDTSRRDETGRLYRRDGRPLTGAEHDLLSTSTSDETAMAAAHRLPDAADWMSERSSVGRALVSLYMKYAYLLPDDSLDSVYDLMTDEDYAEFERLADIHSALSALEEHPELEED